MNYGKKGITKIQKSLTSKSVKLKKMCCVAALKLILIALLAFCIIGACLGIGAFKGILYSAPSISNVGIIPQGYATVVYDAQGNESTKLVAADSNRSWESMDKIPKNLANAFVAIEDERFYQHNGIDIKGIIRAGVQVIKDRRLSQGASTITQQLLKNNVFDGWTDESTMQSIKRKIQEQYLALELEKVWDKDQILECYMNSINLGQNTLGVKAAAQRYFNKPTYQLTLSECAVIAGITQNPSKYNPISHPDKNAERREKVLNNMKEQGMISQAEYDEAMADDVYSRIATVNEEVEDKSVFTYFVDALTEQVLEDLMEVKGYNETQAYNLLYSGGLSIYTTQDPDIQAICDDVFGNEENYPADTKWYLNYALTVKKANGEKENHSSEMFKSYFKQTNSSFNMLYPSKEDAQAVKQEIGTYIAGQLKLELSDEKTLVTKATDRAKFLGFEIRVTPQSNHTKKTKSGSTARNYSGHVMLEVPTSAIQKKLLELGAMRIDVRNGTEIWQPTHRGKLVGRTDLSILDQYNGEIRGFCNYYAIANNRSKLHKFRYIMEYSFYKTLACKYRTTKRKIIVQYRIGKDIGVKFQDKHGKERIRLLWQGSLARDPYPLGKEADIIHKPKGILKKPSLGARLKANRCEWCGKETSALVMHQVRTLKELDESQPWAAFMKKINRKTLVVCESCHTKIHSADCE